jgi:peptidoglycan/LPS O-acetylase OafA/YrhL
MTVAANRWHAEPGRFTQLDALRFFFALVVVLVHTIGFKLTLIRGGFAVDFFFVLSGFVLSHALISRPMSASAFLWARFARLYPLHLATLIWLVCLVGGLAPIAVPEYSSMALALNLGLLQGLGILEVQTWNFPSWSISVEFLVNVLILYPIVRMRSVATATILVLLSALAILVAWGPVFDQFNVQKVYGTVLSGGLLRGTVGILLGYLLYEAHLFVRPRLDVGRYSIAATFFEVVAIVMLAFCMWTNDLRWNLLPAPLSALLVLQMATVPGRLSKILQSSLFSALGNMSYSIYLIHVPLFLTFIGAGILPMPETRFSPFWFAYFALLLILAAASFRYVERPAQRRLMRAFSA